MLFWSAIKFTGHPNKTSAAEEGGGFKMQTVADKGGGGLSLADVSKNT